MAPRSTKPFIFPRLIKWVPGISGNLVVKSKLPPRNTSVALRHHHKKGIIKFDGLKDSWFYGLQNCFANFRKNNFTKLLEKIILSTGFYQVLEIIVDISVFFRFLLSCHEVHNDTKFIMWRKIRIGVRMNNTSGCVYVRQN